MARDYRDLRVVYYRPKGTTSSLPSPVSRIRPKPRAPQSSLADSAADGPMPRQHSEDEWLAVYPHIERMYVQERRKLRDLMQRMQKEYGFAATLQMYKKRFRKWGFTKYTARKACCRVEAQQDSASKLASASPRPSQSSSSSSWATESTAGSDRKTENPSVVQASTSQSSPNPTQIIQPSRATPTLTLPSLTPLERSLLLILSKTHAWSASYFESQTRSINININTNTNTNINTNLPSSALSFRCPLYPWQAAHSGLQLAASLLNQNQGILAGRMARKAFLLLEGILDLDGPALAWNMHEILFCVADRGHTRLLEVLLQHLVNLARSRARFASPEHPLRRITEGLLGVVMRCRREKTASQESLDEVDDDANLNSILHLLSTVASTNAALVLRVRDQRPAAARSATTFAHRGMYDALLWDGVSLFNNAQSHVRSDGGDVMQRHLRTMARQVTKLPWLQGRIRENDASVAELSGVGLGHGIDTRTDDGDAEGPVEMILFRSRFSATREEEGCVPREHARVAAAIAVESARVCVKRGDEEMEEAEGMLGRAVRLREYGYGRNHPQVVWGMWGRADVLRQMGRIEEAEMWFRRGLERCEAYLVDIPVDEV